MLCVSNLSESLDYYEKVLGFDISWRWSESEEFSEEEKPTFACAARGECSIFLCEKGQGKPGAWIFLHLCNKDELEEACAEYKGKAADIVEAPAERPWGMCEMLVKDLDGNTFRIGCATN